MEYILVRLTVDPVVIADTSYIADESTCIAVTPGPDATASNMGGICP